MVVRIRPNRPSCDEQSHCISSLLVIWYIVSFRQDRTDRPSRLFMVCAPLYLASDDVSLGAAPSVCAPFYGDKIGSSTLDARMRKR